MEFHFEELEVWQKAFDLAERIYEITTDFPKDQQFSLTPQLQRATLVSLNIAEGVEGGTRKNLFNFFISPEVPYTKQ
ncbi:MAG: four helix bundle protein [Actinomycetota bacterium]|nr:four helix bundle protein [Actinomycetota bacterium]